MQGRLLNRTGVVLMAGGVIMICSLAQGDTKYVDDSATGGLNDGSSWPNAWTSLETALSGNNVSTGDQLRIAEGIYKPTTGNDRSASFVMKRIQLKGGYAGYGAADPDARDTVLYPTILSGEIGQSGPSDNSYQVVIFADSEMAPEDTLLEGVTITGGNTAGSTVHGGAGIWISGGASPRIQSCKIKSNLAPGGLDGYYGGGLHAYSIGQETTAPVFIDCTFEDNVSLAGGGLYVHDNAAVKLIACTLINNSASCGPAVNVTNGAEVELINCLLTGNEFTTTCLSSSGVIHLDTGSSVTIKSCTFAANGGRAYAQFSGGPSYIHNSILWDNPGGLGLYFDGELHIAYSDVEDGDNSIGPDSPTSYSNNLDVDPAFIAPSSGNFRLHCDSPVRDQGNNSLVPPDDFDIDGDTITTEEETPDRDLKLRVADSVVDMGCYERLADDACAGDITANGVVDVSDLLLVINSWGTCVGCPADVDPGVCDGDDQVTVSELLIVINSWGVCPDGPPGDFLTSPPQSVDDCWSDCETKCQGSQDPNCWNDCYNACVTALCEAEIIDCD